MLGEPNNAKPVDQVIIRGNLVSYHHLLTHPPHYGNLKMQAMTLKIKLPKVHLLINSLSMPFNSSRFCVFVKGEDCTSVDVLGEALAILR